MSCHPPVPQLTLLFVYSYVRLELLQGVAAFHSGDKQASHHLSSALAKWQRLQVGDQALATLASMGFTTSQVKPYALVPTLLQPVSV